MGLLQPARFFRPSQECWWPVPDAARPRRGQSLQRSINIKNQTLLTPSPPSWCVLFPFAIGTLRREQNLRGAGLPANVAGRIELAAEAGRDPRGSRGDRKST